MMRRLVFIALVLLVPLRGFAGDAMAVRMLGAPPAAAAQATVFEAAQAIPERSAGQMSFQGHPDCQGHPAADLPAAGALADSAPAGLPACDGCLACQLGHLLALAPDVAGSAALALPQAVPAACRSLHASNTPPAQFKPPIC